MLTVMKFFSAFLLALAVCQASAKPEPHQSFQSNGFNNLNSINSGYGSSLPVLNTHIQTAVMENPTVNFPSCIPPTAISESCHCMRTLVRPQIRNEIIAVPTIDRIVRTVSTPIVETINCGGGSRLATFTQGNNILSGASGTRSLSDVIQRNSNSARSTNVFFNEANLGRGFTTDQNTNAVTSGVNGVNIGLVARPSIITFQTSNAGNSQGFSNIISGNSGFSNSAKSVGSNVHVIVK